MDEKGANSFPFHNLPLELKKIISKVFPVLFHLSFWIKKSRWRLLLTATFAIKRKTIKSVLPPYLRTGDSVGENSKSGVTLGLDHIYLLTLFDLYALHYGYLFGFESSTRIWDTL